MRQAPPGDLVMLILAVIALVEHTHAAIRRVRHRLRAWHMARWRRRHGHGTEGTR